LCIDCRSINLQGTVPHSLRSHHRGCWVLAVSSWCSSWLRFGLRRPGTVSRRIYLSLCIAPLSTRLRTMICLQTHLSHISKCHILHLIHVSNATDAITHSGGSTECCNEKSHNSNDLHTTPKPIVSILGMHG